MVMFTALPKLRKTFCRMLLSEREVDCRDPENRLDSGFSAVCLSACLLTERGEGSSSNHYP